MRVVVMGTTIGEGMSTADALNLMIEPILLAEGMVDALNLMIEPILLGGGKRIFPEDGTARPLELVKCVTTGTGVQVCTYQPVS